MKKWFAYGAFFLSVYVIFLIATIPATWLVTWIKLPANIQLIGVEGSIWQTSIKTVRVDGLEINQVDSELSFLSVLSLDSTVKLNFGGSLVKGPEGSLTVSQLFNELKIENLQLNLAANQIAERLKLPVPVIAHNRLDVQISTFVVGQPMCEQLSGSFDWPKAAVTALSEKVALGGLSAELSCEKGAVMLTMNPKNDLGLSFTAYVNGVNRISGDGFIKPGSNFPSAMKSLLPFLGKADNQGRYRLRL